MNLTAFDAALLFIVVAVLYMFSEHETEREAAIIEENTRLNKKTDHGPFLLRRLIFIGVLCFGMASVTCLIKRPASVWEVLGIFVAMGGMMWGAYTIMHRMMLNAALGHRWLYISRSTWYDRRFVDLPGSALGAYLLEGIVHVSSYIYIINA